MKGKNVLAISLIALGAIILLQNTGIFDGELVLFIISLGFFAAYYMAGGASRKSSVGFLIPASILLFIGIFTVFENNFLVDKAEGSIFFLLLGSAFFLIYFLHNFRIPNLRFGERNWPAITGLSLYAFGTLIFLLEFMEFEFARIILENLWPIGLIFAGVIIILKNFRKQR